MKFLCVECDAPMALESTTRSDPGSLTVLFRCGTCGKATAMLTNAMETQMVNSLGVKVGGRKAAAAPMETIRSNLSGYSTGDGGSSAGAPDPATAAQSASAPHSAGAPQSASAADHPAGPDTGSKCPFTGVAAEALSAPSGLTWTPEAEARMEKIPGFVRSMVKRGIEDSARQEGVSVIDLELIARVRGQMGM
jgi:proto-chlorophyllide reductase subunit